jgi:gamma-glutamyltranspeptidase/glutathione hydrolase
VERTPLRGTYRGHEIFTTPPPSSGGIALVEMLNMLERYDLKALGDSSDAHHLMIEVMRRAFADRAEFLGDPDFVRVPVRGLLSKEYAAKTAATIDLNRATPSATLRHGDPLPYESRETTHYSVVDAQGNAVSTTYTLNESFGSGVTAKGTGVLLNNEMDDFTSKPAFPTATGWYRARRTPSRRASVLFLYDADDSDEKRQAVSRRRHPGRSDDHHAGVADHRASGGP